MKIQSIRGMNDLLPPEVYLWHEVEKVVQQVFESFGFSEIRTPLLEMTALFKRGVGEDTDIVEKEMYSFKDRSGDDLSLRPEGTASVVRAMVEHSWLEQNPITKLYYVGPMFRHERPQKGRYRQFHQVGAELFGVDAAAADVEVMALGTAFLKKLGFQNVELRLSSIGCANCRPNYKKILIEKIEPHKNELPAEFLPRIYSNPQRIFDQKDEKSQKIASILPHMLDYLCNDCEVHFEQVQKGLNTLKVPFIIDPKIVRGLDYYNRSAFEFVSAGLGSQSAVGGGGRYDKLVEDLGGKNVPAVGFAFGLERIVMLLTQMREAKTPPTDVFFVYPDESGYEKCMQFCHELRIRNFRSELDLQGRSMKAQMKRADKVDSRFCVIIGGQELSRNVAIVRNMKTKEQAEVSFEQLIEDLVEKNK